MKIKKTSNDVLSIHWYQLIIWAAYYQLRNILRRLIAESDNPIRNIPWNSNERLFIPSRQTKYSFSHRTNERKKNMVTFPFFVFVVVKE